MSSSSIVIGNLYKKKIFREYRRTESIHPQKLFLYECRNCMKIFLKNDVAENAKEQWLSLKQLSKQRKVARTLTTLVPYHIAHSYVVRT